MNSFIKYLLLWALSGIVGMYLTYGAVSYVDSKASITRYHVINGAILGPMTFGMGIASWIFILAGEAKNWWENEAE